MTNLTCARTGCSEELSPERAEWSRFCSRGCWTISREEKSARQVERRAALKDLLVREDMVELRARSIISIAELDCCQMALRMARDARDSILIAQCEEAEADARERHDEASHAIYRLERDVSLRRYGEGSQ